jgi:membrane protein implicated in regulation of membrane protease activity
MLLVILAVIAALLWLPSPLGWILVGLAAVWEAVQTAASFHWSQRSRPRVGVEDLIGREAIVAVACEPEGQVRVFGELWRAVCKDGAARGERVIVEAVDGLTLTVVPRI